MRLCRRAVPESGVIAATPSYPVRITTMHGYDFRKGHRGAIGKLNATVPDVSATEASLLCLAFSGDEMSNNWRSAQMKVINGLLDDSICIRNPLVLA